MYVSHRRPHMPPFVNSFSLFLCNGSGGVKRRLSVLVANMLALQSFLLAQPRYFLLASMYSIDVRSL